MASDSELPEMVIGGNLAAVAARASSRMVTKPKEYEVRSREYEVGSKK